MSASDLPSHLFSSKILSLLSRKDLLVVAQVCKQWSQLATDEMRRIVVCSFCHNVIFSTFPILPSCTFQYPTIIYDSQSSVQDLASLLEQSSRNFSISCPPTNPRSTSMFCRACQSKVGTARSTNTTQGTGRYVLRLSVTDTVLCDTQKRCRDGKDNLFESREEAESCSPSCRNCGHSFQVAFSSSFIGTVYHKIHSDVPAHPFLAFRHIAHVVSNGSSWESFISPPRRANPAPTVVRHVPICCVNCRFDVGVQISGCADESAKLSTGNILRYFLDPVNVLLPAT